MKIDKNRHSSLSSPLRKVITALAEKAFNETAQPRAKAPTNQTSPTHHQS